MYEIGNVEGTCGETEDGGTGVGYVEGVSVGVTRVDERQGSLE